MLSRMWPPFAVRLDAPITLPCYFPSLSDLSHHPNMHLFVRHHNCLTLFQHHTLQTCMYFPTHPSSHLPGHRDLCPVRCSGLCLAAAVGYCKAHCCHTSGKQCVSSSSSSWSLRHSSCPLPHKCQCAVYPDLVKLPRGEK